MTTNYAPTINHLSGHEMENLKVAFTMRDIVSARLFDRALYVSFLGTRSDPV